MTNSNMTKLEREVSKHSSMINEFINQEDIKNLVRTATRKSMWAWKFLDLPEEKRKLLDDVVLLYELAHCLNWYKHDNRKRHQHDGLYKFTDCNGDSHAMYFPSPPKSDEFYKEKYPTHLYGYTVMDMKDMIRKCRKK